jgi:3-deoxy-manno-octulosonate cytidylyltransferase (CMP-KDO synthetase)
MASPCKGLGLDLPLAEEPRVSSLKLPLTLKDWLVCIPARLSSTRLPQKPLQDLCGEPLIVRVCRNLGPLASAGAKLLVATDSEAIVDVCARAGFAARMTREDHQSGTDRCFEAASLEFANNPTPRPWILNVQGDEPFVSPDDLQRLCHAMEHTAKTPGTNLATLMGTLAHTCRDVQMFKDPNVVKVVRAQDGHAVYFSRAGVPFDRDRPTECFWQHVGVYAFSRESLARFCALGPSPLEEREKLEQLRAIEAGWRIVVSDAAHATRGIDTPQDLEAARRALS